MTNEKIVSQMIDYDFINTNTSLEKIKKDIDLFSIANKTISEDDISEELSLSFDLDELRFVQRKFVNVKLTIDRFVEEGHDLSIYEISEEPILDSFVVMSEEKDIGIDIIIENDVATPYYVDNHTNFPFNTFKAKTITEAFNKCNP